MRNAWNVSAVGLLLMGLSVASGPPANAAMDPTFGSALLTDNRTAVSTGAIVTASMIQLDYRDISFNVGFEGFTANHVFEFGRGACPKDLVIVKAPARVFKCGWEQRGTTALLRLALLGTFDRGRITVSFAEGALTAPPAPGRYSVTLSGWSFDDVTDSVRVVSSCVDGTKAAGQNGFRGDVAC